MAQSPVVLPLTVSRPRPLTFRLWALTSVGAAGSFPWQWLELSLTASTEGSGVVSVKLQLPLSGLGFRFAFAWGGAGVTAGKPSAATAMVARRFIAGPPR